MKLYNSNRDKIENIETINSNGSHYVSKMTDEELNNLGYYKIQYVSTPNTRYYNYEKTAEVLQGVYVVSYIITEKPLANLKEAMVRDLKEAFLGYSERPRVDTGLGYFVDGGMTDVKNFEIGKKYAIPQIKDADGGWHDATQEDYDTIISAIELSGINIYQKKWNIEKAIQNLGTVESCIIFEATPYNVTEDILDENGEPTGETQVIEKFRNNVTEWF